MFQDIRSHKSHPADLRGAKSPQQEMRDALQETDNNEDSNEGQEHLLSAGNPRPNLF